MTSGELQLLRELLELMDSPDAPLEQRRARYDRAHAAFGGSGGPPGEMVRIGASEAEWALPYHPGLPVLLYLHGGSYTMGSPASHRHLIRALGAELGAGALALHYRRAPEHPFPAAVTDAVASYRWLLDQGVDPAQLLVAGDSAGGGLALAAMLSLREQHVALPAGVVCISPWADLTFSFAAHRSHAERDPVLRSDDLRAMAALYVGAADPSHPQLSPVFADLSGLPPLLIQVGSEEILVDDARELGRRAESCGVPVTFEEWSDMIHVWHYYFPVLPEGRRAIEAIATFARGVFAPGSGSRRTEAIGA